MNVLIIGPQGSGKGTQAEKLAEKFQLAHVEMGEILRGIVKEDTILGNKVNEVMNLHGKLVPDDIIFEIINNYLKNIGKLDGIIFDGFPRIISQAQYLDKFLAESGKKINLVIYLTLSREETLKRLTNRRICKKCGQVYNLLTKSPKKEGFCDICDGELILRTDETPQAINTRLNEFLQKTKPLIEFYRQKGILEEVDGNRPIEVIFEEIVGRLKKRGLIADGQN